MQVRRFDRVADFSERTERFLARHEAYHNLLLGIAAGLRESPTPATPPYLAAVEDEGEVVAVALMTPPYNIVLSLAPSAALALIAADLHRDRPTLPGVLAPKAEAGAFADHWRALSGQPVAPGVAQRIYQLEAVTPAPGVPGAMRRATPDDRELLVAWYQGFFVDAHGRARPRQQDEREIDARLATPTSGLCLWIDEEPVALAGYGGPTPNGIRVGPVYTPPEHRRRGYASALTAALSQWLLDGGRRYCFLFTDLANLTSNHIYQAIGYRPVCDVDEHRFLPLASTP